MHPMAKGVLFAAASSISILSFLHSLPQTFEKKLSYYGNVPYGHAVLRFAGCLCSEACRWHARGLGSHLHALVRMSRGPQQNHQGIIRVLRDVVAAAPAASGAAAGPSP